MGALKLSDDFYWIGSLDPDLRVFDIVMYTDYGTSYNSYLLKTDEGVVLFETVKARFFDEYIQKIKEVADLDDLNYLVVNHTEPDHAGSIEMLLNLAPHIQVICTKVAHTFLEEICNRDIPSHIISDGEVFPVGEVELEFLSVPFLHWPDSMYTYIRGREILVTCDSFGCHYADERVTNDRIDGSFIDAYKYYFDMIMGPFKKHVRYALDRIEKLPLKSICPGHGPVLVKDIPFYIDLYRKWSFEEEAPHSDRPKVVNVYVSAYGYTKEMAKEISRGVLESVDANLLEFDMVEDSFESVLEEIKSADAILLGTPTINGDALPPIMDLLMNLNGINHGGKVAASYGSYGWSGEGPDMVNSRLKILRMNTLEPPFKVNFKSSPRNRAEARSFGSRFGKKVAEAWESMGFSADGKTYWKCTVCGEVIESVMPPVVCPVCGVGQEAFVETFQDNPTFSDNTPRKMVIVGGGASAIAAAEAIRKRNGIAEISIFSDEAIPPYYRPLLTERLGGIESDSFYLKTKQWFNSNNIDLYLNSRVSKVDSIEKCVTLESGEVHSFDRLLIATGGTPFVPPIEGKSKKGVFTLRKISDVQKIGDHINNNIVTDIVVVGGGLLGLEAAWNLSAKEGISVTVVDTADRVLPRQTDRRGAEFLRSYIERGGIRVVTGAVVNEIYGSDGKVDGVSLSTGENIFASIVIISAGVAPQASLTDGSGISVSRGIEVGRTMETSVPDIYAAGDCAAINGQYWGLWETALEQGVVAGASMAGDKKTFNPTNYPATLNAFGINLLQIGELLEGCDDESVETVVYCDTKRGVYRSLCFRDDILVGGLLIGDLKIAAPLITAVRRRSTFQEALDSKVLA